MSATAGSACGEDRRTIASGYARRSRWPHPRVVTVVLVPGALGVGRRKAVVRAEWLVVLVTESVYVRVLVFWGSLS